MNGELLKIIFMMKQQITCESSTGARPGLELLRVRRNHIGFINDPHSEKPVIKMRLLQTKKQEHTFTLADWWRDEVYPNILNRHQNCNELDYLFFPKVENREKLFERIRKNFVRLADDVDLYELPDGRKRPIYVYRHSFITGRRKKGVNAEVLALHSNNSPTMINKHYSVLTDDHLLEIHNQIFPERRKSTQKLKVITKK